MVSRAPHGERTFANATYCERTLEQATSERTLDNEGGMLTEDALEVRTTAATLVQSRWDEALRSRVL